MNNVISVEYVPAKGWDHRRLRFTLNVSLENCNANAALVGYVGAGNKQMVINPHHISSMPPPFMKTTLASQGI